MEATMGAQCWHYRLLGAFATGLGILLADAGPAHAQMFRPRGSDCPSYPSYIPSPAPMPGTATIPTPTTPEGTLKMEEAPSTPATSTPHPEPTPSPYDTTDLGGGTLASIDSAVGYIDSAIPTNVIRFRFDAAYNANRPERDEFFYAQYEPGGPGFAKPESKIDYQEISAYLETVICPHFSAFIEVPYLMLNPTINQDSSGFSDMNLGFKWAVVSQQDMTTTFQLRVFVPTGDAHEGLGTRHVSVEPSLLFLDKLSERLILESELRLWAPVGGTDYAGDVVRYGVGLSYGDRPKDSWWLVPVVEFVGWTSLGGKEAVNVTVPTLEKSATGDTIVNIKAGLRLGMGERFNIYAGYGRALTGDVWYKDIWRTELCIYY
jgi:hypothetical protein